MTEDPQDGEYLDLFKPKKGDDSEGGPQRPESDRDADRTQPSEPLEDSDLGHVTREREIRSESEGWDPTTRPENPVRESIEEQNAGLWEYERAGEARLHRSSPIFSFLEETNLDPRSVGVIAGGGCLLVVLAAVVVFAFYQVFVRTDVGDQVATDTPPPTSIAAITPSPTIVVAESPVFVPLVDSRDVRVPIVLPVRMLVGETSFQVEAVNAPPDTWPSAPPSAEVAHWVYGTVVNYVMGLAPTPGNIDLISALRGEDTLSLHMSTGRILNFTVDAKTTGLTDDAAFFSQTSPRLTLALLTDDPSQRVVVRAGFFSDETAEVTELPGAIIGLVGTPVNQGPVRVTLIEVYQADSAQTGLPPGTGYLLIDIRIENIGTQVLQPDFFQTFVSDAMGERYPLTLLAEQFTHYGVPTEPLAPGETVVGSIGFLVSSNAGGQVQWVFNPLPGTDHWIVVPISFELAPPAPTPMPSPPAGFAVVTVNSRDVFVNREDGLLDIGLRIQNVSEGIVQVTADDISLTSWTDGELSLVAPAPMLPWRLDPDELQLFQLQFELPTTDTALLDVLGYTFSIENLGGP